MLVQEVSSRFRFFFGIQYRNWFAHAFSEGTSFRDTFRCFGASLDFLPLGLALLIHSLH